jgi:hypothetical protein
LSPTVGAQSLTLVHVYAQPAPQVAPQVLVLEQSILQSAPHWTLQFGPLAHWNEQWSAQCVRQSDPKLAQLSEQLPCDPQSRLQLSCPWQEHDASVHVKVPPDEQDSRTTSSSAAREATAERTRRR